ncbi:MAG: flagellar motor protein MotB [Desulfatirhabdiaceae bacterium]
MNPKKSKHQDASGSRIDKYRWQVTYSGFIMMLLCFFIMLSSFSMMESSKISRFLKSFSTEPNILSGGKRFESNKVILPEAPEMIDYRSHMAGIHRDIQQIITGLNMNSAITVSASEAGVVMRFSDSIVFQSGYADILPDAKLILQKVCSIISDYPCHIRIEGHTDNVPIKSGQFPSNWELSAARAINVMRVIMQSVELSPERLSAVGFGEFRPLYANDSDNNRAGNRRVEVYLMPSDTRRENAP